MSYFREKLLNALGTTGQQSAPPKRKVRKPKVVVLSFSTIPKRTPTRLENRRLKSVAAPIAIKREPAAEPIVSVTAKTDVPMKSLEEYIAELFPDHSIPDFLTVRKRIRGF